MSIETISRIRHYAEPNPQDLHILPMAMPGETLLKIFDLFNKHILKPKEPKCLLCKHCKHLNKKNPQLAVRK